VGISRFVAPIDFAHRNFQPLAVHVSGLTVLGMQDAPTGETLLWVHDPASQWKNDAAGIEPKVWKDVKVPVSASRPLRIEVWDTRKGVILSRSDGAPVSGMIELQLPPFQRDIAVRLR
jgi:hypothetical protein